MKITRYLQTMGSVKWYYRSMNEIFRTLFGKNLMLHYPFYKEQNESFEQRQINLVDHCLNEIDGLSRKTLLEVGCGNGINCKYISGKNGVMEIIGVDLNEDNLKIAREDQTSRKIRFIQDDAQKLDHIPDHSVDIIICIESAFHYPDKNAFFKQIKRVLKPDGQFVIADILRRSNDKGRSLWFWKKGKLLHHANEEDYKVFASGNQLKYVKLQDISDQIIRGYDGHTNWISRDRLSWRTYHLMKFTTNLQIRLNLKELRAHKRYMLLSGVHA